METCAKAPGSLTRPAFNSVWSTDHVIASAPILDSTVVLATAAAVTGRVKIGFGVMLLALRPVAWAAKQISTLQYVSGERVLLGVGKCNPAHGDIGWRAVGASYADRGRRTDDALAVLPDLIAGRPVSLDGGPPVAIAPGATIPPLLIAGEARPALRRAAIFGDGWLAIGLSPEAVATRLGELRRLTKRARAPSAHGHRSRASARHRAAASRRAAQRIRGSRH